MPKYTSYETKETFIEKHPLEKKKLEVARQKDRVTANFIFHEVFLFSSTPFYGNENTFCILTLFLLVFFFFSMTLIWTWKLEKQKQLFANDFMRLLITKATKKLREFT